MSEEMKPCPFCGGEAVVDIVDCPQTLASQNCDTPYIRVVCLACDAQTVDSLYPDVEEADAIKSWNRRV